MSIVYDVLVEEKARINDKISLYSERINQLPKGSIVIKSIKGHQYNYLVYREGDKVVTKYLKKDEVEEVRAKLGRRKKIEEILRDLKKDMKYINRVVKE